VVPLSGSGSIAVEAVQSYLRNLEFMSYIFLPKRQLPFRQGELCVPRALMAFEIDKPPVPKQRPTLASFPPLP
jgi:hypothetical protein